MERNKMNQETMINDLEIRAAKALGWKSTDDEFRGLYYDVPKEHWDRLGCMQIYERQFKFTTSYDWSMLLAKKVKDMGYKFILETYNMVDFCNKKQEIYRVRIWDELDQEELLSADNEDGFEKFPELITETCLDFFEMMKKDKS